jgi:hypothetical protein
MNVFAAMVRAVYGSVYMFGHDYLSIAWPRSMVTKGWKRGDGAFAVSFVVAMWGAAFAFALNDWAYPRELVGRWGVVGIFLVSMAVNHVLVEGRGWGALIEQEQRHLSVKRRTLHAVAALSFVALSVTVLAMTVMIGRSEHCSMSLRHGGCA